jgi:hypothetical protein
LQQGCFPGAAWPHNAVQFSFGDMQVNALQYLKVAE